MKLPAAQRLAIAILSLALVIGSAAAAGASPGHRLTWREYHADVVAINTAYVAAVDQAKATLAAALAAAKTPGQRSTARAQYTLSIVEATQTRDQALVALGPPPPGAGSGARASGPSVAGAA